MTLPRIRVYQRKKLALERLTLGQRAMYELGKVGLDALKARLAAGRNTEDAPAKPLGRVYALRKTKAGRGRRRDLRLTGEMLDNLQVRTVSENAAYARNSIQRLRDKAQGNEDRERWFAYSPANQRQVVIHAAKVIRLPKLKE